MEITSNRESLVPQTGELTVLQRQRLARLAELLAEFQAMTRQMSEYEAGIWIRSLSSCRLEDIERAMQDFVETATKDDAHRVRLGDINQRIDSYVDKRNAEYIRDQNARNRERWKAEQEAEIAADPEGFEHARKEAQEKFRKMFGKSLEQTIAESNREVQASGIVDAMDDKA